jgi:hypothetical protein
VSAPLNLDAIQARAEAQNKAGDWAGSLTRRMILCPSCGNKRCPKATWHENECTGSNESGQPGSSYTAHVFRTLEEQRALMDAWMKETSHE